MSLKSLILVSLQELHSYFRVAVWDKRAYQRLQRAFFRWRVWQQQHREWRRQMLKAGTFLRETLNQIEAEHCRWYGRRKLHPTLRDAPYLCYLILHQGLLAAMAPIFGVEEGREATCCLVQETPRSAHTASWASTLAEKCKAATPSSLRHSHSLPHLPSPQLPDLDPCKR